MRRDAKGLAGLEGEPVDPTEPSTPPTAVIRMSFSWLLMDSPLRKAVFDQGRPQPILQAGEEVPRLILTGQGGGFPVLAIKSQIKTALSRLVRDLSGEWSRFGLLCLGLSRFVSVSRLGPGPRWLVEDGFRSVSPLFLRAIAMAVPGGALPTLKTGNGENSFVGSNPTPSVWVFAGVRRLWPPAGSAADWPIWREGLRLASSVRPALVSSGTRGCLPGSDPTLNPHIRWYRKSKPVNHTELRDNFLPYFAQYR